MGAWNKGVSSSRRKNRRNHFSAPSNVRRKILSAPCSKDVAAKFGLKRLSMPIRKDDEVQIVRGKYKEEPAGKVIAVYRKRMCIFVERVVKEKANGSQIQVPVHPSNCVITKLKQDPDRKNLINRKKQAASGGDNEDID